MSSSFNLTFVYLSVSRLVYLDESVFIHINYIILYLKLQKKSVFYEARQNLRVLSSANVSGHILKGFNLVLVLSLI